MSSIEIYEKNLQRLKGKTVAIVYIFEGETAPGFNHYHIWKSDVISEWMNGLLEMHCTPFILDVRTFTEKAINNTLPHIDYVLNLNCGSCELSPMGLIPSISAFCGIPCIPCGTVSIVSGENKYMSNLLAKAIDLSVPKALNESSKDGIFRPLNYGSSLGVQHGEMPKNSETVGVYQEFIPGYDITTPIAYNPLTQKLDFFPTIVYLPDSKDMNWFFGSTQKEEKQGYQRTTIHNITPELKDKYLALTKAFSIETFCRIDARIRCTEPDKIKEILSRPLGLDDLYFIEINPMPTVKSNNSFCYSFNKTLKTDSFFESIQIHQKVYGSVSPHSFLLSSSMLALNPSTKKDRIITIS